MAAVLGIGDRGAAAGDRGRSRALGSVLERALTLAIVALAYYGLGHASLSVALPPGVATPVWPPSGLALAAVILVGSRVWPALFLSSFFLNSGVLLQGSRPEWGAFTTSLFIGAGSTLQALLGAYGVRRVTGGRPLFIRGSDVFKFLAIVILTCFVASSFGTLALLGGRFIEIGAAGTHWRTWWIGDLVGILVFAPMLLSLVNHSYQWIDRKRLVEFGLFCVGLLATARLVFHPLEWEGPFRSNLTFLITPFLLCAAFRFRQAGVALSVLLVSLVSLQGTLKNSGPFSGLPLNQSLTLLQVFLGILSITGITIAAILAQHRSLEEERLESLEREKAARLDLSRSNRELEHFAYLASHDLQEPLRTVSLHLSLLKRRLGDALDEESDRSIAFAVGGAKQSMLLITHDLGIVSTIADRVVVLYAGKVVEDGPTMQIIGKPTHPYTEALMRSSLLIPNEEGKLYAIPGGAPRPGEELVGCRFRARCHYADALGIAAKCEAVEPGLHLCESGHQCRCWAVQDGLIQLTPADPIRQMVVEQATATEEVV